MNVTRACLYLEIDGKTYLAKTSEIVDLNLMVELLGSLTKSAKLKCFQVGDDFKWETIQSPMDLNKKEVSNDV